MNEQKNNRLAVPGILLFLYSAITLLYFFTNMFNVSRIYQMYNMIIFSDDLGMAAMMARVPSYSYISTFVFLAITVILGISLIIKNLKMTRLSIIGLLAVYIYKLVYNIIGLSIRPFTIKIGMISVFSNLFIIASILCLLFFINLNIKEKESSFSNFWFIPIVLDFIGSVFVLTVMGMRAPIVWYLIIKILYWVGITIMAYSFTHKPKEKVIYNAPTGITTNGEQNTYNDVCYGYCDMAKHILLLLFTFGIWQYIWIYRTTDFLNITPNEEKRDPVSKLLLCMFVPFYYIYWTYKSAQRVDNLAISKGQQSDISTLCLILSIFVGIVPPILMQDKINNIARQKTATDVKTVPIQDINTTPVGVADEIKKYKELLDTGVITEEEFDAKKKQLLDL